MSNVTLCVDAIEAKPGGIGRYTWELARGLSQRDDLTVKFYGRNRLIADLAPLRRGDTLSQGPRKLKQWWDKRAMKASLVHGPNYFLPDFAERGIITVHDLSVFLYPLAHPAARVLAFESEFLKSLSRATHIITDTETVRDETIEMFSIRPEMITSIPLGVEPIFRPMSMDALARPLAQLGVSAKSYALCVSTLEPRKKISELLDAWRLLPSALRIAFPLVLCGGEGWQNGALLDRVERGVAEGWLYYLGFVEEGLLPTLYAGAALFLYPSIYEGFGLPPVEAMACGTPVVVSNRSCMPEVCGDAARYVDPDDIPAFAAAIADSLEDSGWQRESAALGLERAGRYTWSQCVASTAELYHRATWRGGED